MSRPDYSRTTCKIPIYSFFKALILLGLSASYAVGQNAAFECAIGSNGGARGNLGENSFDWASRVARPSAKHTTAKTIASGVGLTNAWLAEQGQLCLKTRWAKLAPLRGGRMPGGVGGRSALTARTRFIRPSLGGHGR